MKPFMINCNPALVIDSRGPKCAQSSQENFSFVQVDVESEIENTRQTIIKSYTAQVLCILQEFDKTESKESRSVRMDTKLIVAWLEDVPEHDRAKNNMPYRQLRYNLVGRERRTLYTSVIDCSSIKSSTFVFPIISSVVGYNHYMSNQRYQKDVKFIELPVQRIAFWSSNSYNDFVHGTMDSNLDQVGCGNGSLLEQDDIRRYLTEWVIDDNDDDFEEFDETILSDDDTCSDEDI